MVPLGQNRQACRLHRGQKDSSVAKEPCAWVPVAAPVDCLVSSSFDLVSPLDLKGLSFLCEHSCSTFLQINTLDS